MTQVFPTVKSVFDAALDITDPAARNKYLQSQCRLDSLMRARVEALLAAHQNAGSFLESVPSLFATTDEPRTLTESPGTIIGPYRLLEQIGEGGFGVVFLAEQSAPVKRKVALKVIKPGMDSRQVVARFEAERQALALMDHPNIARVLDAGETETGRPYFVMELVRGVQITDYCDRVPLAPRQRLELFVTICQAVQHAHQKGIIHRDIKPSNVLVTLHNNQPVTKVIDFGIAKATSGQLTDQTVYTGFAQFMGTPLYMSPEQVAISDVDVDTRSDIYSLGVLLYELLTGTTPVEKSRLQQASFDDMRRMIREFEPERPSARVTTLGAACPTLAVAGQLEPRRMSQWLRGDLDWIVMKALEKDRARRYATADELAADVLRFLHDEPVVARPPSAIYLFRKFARRHRTALSTISLVVLTLIIGSGVSIGLAVRAMRAEALAQQRLIAKNDALRDARGARAEVQQSLVRVQEAQQLAESRADQLRQSVEDLQAANQLLDRGHVFVERQRWDDADAAYSRALELRPESARLWEARAFLYLQLGLFELAASDLDRSYSLQEPILAWNWRAHAILLRHVGDEQSYRDVAAHMQRQFAAAEDPLPAVETTLVMLLGPSPQLDATLAVELMESIVERDAKNGWFRYALGVAYYRSGNYEGAIQQLTNALTIDPTWKARQISYPLLAMAYDRLGRADDARANLDLATRAIDEWTRELYEGAAGDWVIHQGAAGNWPILWWDWCECQQYYREAMLLIEGSVPPEDRRLLVVRARALAGLRRTAGALAEYDAALAVRPDDPTIQMESHRTRGYYFAATDWTLAAEEFASARRLAPGEYRLWYFEAISRLASGDTSEYRRLCSQALAEFAATQDPKIAHHIILMCTLDAAGIPEPARLVPLIPTAVRFHHGNESIAAIALYRAGRFDEARTQFQTAARLFRPQAREWCFLAMTEQRLGNTAAAQTALQAAEDWIREADRQDSVDLRIRRPLWESFMDRYEFRHLYSEAQDLVAGETASAPVTRTESIQ